MDNRRLPAEAGYLSQIDQAGPDAVLGGCVFDPSDIPFLPKWPELETNPAELHADQSIHGAMACTEKGFPKTEKEFPRAR